MDILCFGSADYEEPNWVNAQHLMTRLGQRHRVLYVNSLGLRSPRATRSDLRKIWRRAPWRGLRQPDPARELFVLSPSTLPPAWGSMAATIGSFLLALQVRRALSRLHFTRPLAWVFLPSAAPVLRRLLTRGVVYHCVDAYEANPGVDAALVRALEEDLLAQADLVVAASAPLAQRLGLRHPRVLAMPNVVDLESYPPPGTPVAEPPELAGLPHPRLGYVGNLASYKVDLPLIAAAAARRPDLTWVLIGGVGQGDIETRTAPLRRLSNVHFLGPQPRQRLAGFLHHLDVGLIPFVVSPSTRHAFPLKFFEYLACGLPVVCTPLDGLSEHLVAPLAYPYDGEAAFETAVGRALQGRDMQSAQRRREAAERHSWSRRLQEIEELLASFDVDPPRATSLR